MEAISNAANSLGNSFWGKNSVSKDEPQSGVQGDTAKGEPYDGGNMGGRSPNLAEIGDKTADADEYLAELSE